MHTYPYYPNDHTAMTDKASAVTLISSVLTAGWGLVTTQAFGIFAGIVIGVAGLAVNYYFKRKELDYKRREDKRQQELHALTVQRLLEDSVNDVSENHIN